MKKLDVFLLVYKIVILLLVLAVLVWGLYAVYEYAEDVKTGENTFGSGLGVAIVLVLNVIADAALIVLSLPGLITSICRKTAPSRKRDVIHFALITASPAVSFGIFYIVTLIVTNMA